MTLTPRPPKGKRKRPEGLAVAIGLLIVVSLLGVYGAFFMGRHDSTTIQPEQSPYKSLVDRYEVIDNAISAGGQFANLVVLVKDSISDPAELSILARIIKTKECGDTPCNTIDLWSSTEAYKLFKARTQSTAWRKKHWAKLCEQNLAYYITSVDEVQLFPLLDSEYRKYGGKKKRPKLSI